MKVDILDAHDRMKHFTKQSFDIAECCQDLVNQRPFGNHPFYIFAHARTDDDGTTKRLIWQPRLTKPKAQTNSMLFKAYPGTDKIKVIWMIPARELWSQFEKGKLTENQMVAESIDNFVNHREKLEAKESDDLFDYQVDDVYREISQQAHFKKMNKEFDKYLIKPASSQPSVDLSSASKSASLSPVSSESIPDNHLSSDPL